MAATPLRRPAAHWQMVMSVWSAHIKGQRIVRILARVPAGSALAYGRELTQPYTEKHMVVFFSNSTARLYHAYRLVSKKHT